MSTDSSNQGIAAQRLSPGVEEFTTTWPDPRAGSTSQPRVFQFKAQNIFLTYPRCDISVDVAARTLLTLCHRFQPLYILCSQEHHADGSNHLHILLQTDKTMYTRNPHYFDICGHHPNIQPAKSPDNVRAYILKDPITSFEEGSFQPRGSRSNTSAIPRSGNSGTKDSLMRDTINTSTSKDDYLTRVRNSFPFDWATRLQQFEYSASKLFPEPVREYVNPFPPSEPDLFCREIIDRWVYDELDMDITDAFDAAQRRRSLYIVGPTRTGKFTWARSLGRHNYWQHMVDFTAYDTHAKYNILDDVPFKFCPNWKQLVGCQRDFIVNPKYAKRKEIPGGIPCIILQNPDDDWLPVLSPSQMDYFVNNCDVYVMKPGEKFFGGDTPVPEAQEDVPDGTRSS
uniref:Replication-associated protein n=1 Tax=Sugarcane white streak virus TaxID=1492296 RepID=A0A023SHC3_9GEMI|nr:replication associated protein [Sugarcane white streak virus]